MSFVVDINSNDLAFTEVCLSHAMRFSAYVGVFVAANTDFKHIQTLAFQRLEIALVMLRVPVAPPLVCTEEKSEAVQVISVPPAQYSLRDPNKITVLGWREICF